MCTCESNIPTLIPVSLFAVVTYLRFGLGGGATGAANALGGGGVGGNLGGGGGLILANPRAPDLPFTTAPARAAARVSALSLPAGTGRRRKATLFGGSWAYKRPGGRAALKMYSLKFCLSSVSDTDTDLERSRLDREVELRCLD